MGVSDPLAFVVLFCCDGAGLGKKIEDSAGFKWRCIESMLVAMCLLLEGTKAKLCRGQKEGNFSIKNHCLPTNTSKFEVAICSIKITML